MFNPNANGVGGMRSYRVTFARTPMALRLNDHCFSEIGSESILAARMKSFSESPPMACV